MTDHPGARLRAIACRLLLPLLPLLLFGGCAKQELYSQLSERQANEMIAVLQGAGIDADKQSQEGRFTVLTASGDFPQAVRTLNAQGYPRESFDSMGKVFKKEGFVSSPLEERARLIHAMSQEISNTIASIDGVVTARVHIVVPERHPLMEKGQPASAAVFIKHRADKDLGPQIAQIKALVVNSIEGLAYDNVTVALFPAESIGEARSAPPAAAETPRARESALGMPLLVGAAGGAAALLGGLALWWRRRRPAGRVSSTPALPAPSTPLAADALPAAFEARLEAKLQRRPN